VDLGPGRAQGINELGTVLGTSIAADGIRHAFTWRKGVRTDVGPLGDEFGNTADYPPSINDRGEVAGVVEDEEHHLRPFVWSRGVFRELPADTFSADVFGINRRGQVVGNQANLRGGLLWTRGSATEIPTLGGSFAFAILINDRGVVAGNSETAAGEVHAFAFTGGVISDLGTLGGPSSFAQAINRRGQIVGVSAPAPGSPLRAVLWEDGQIVDLGTLGGPGSSPSDINRRGQVVGVAEDADGESHAVIWTVERARR
jgi:probable HAF family extracellular repeat protein